MNGSFVLQSCDRKFFFRFRVAPYLKFSLFLIQFLHKVFENPVRCDCCCRIILFFCGRGGHNWKTRQLLITISPCACFSSWCQPRCCLACKATLAKPSQKVKIPQLKWQLGKSLAFEIWMRTTRGDFFVWSSPNPWVLFPPSPGMSLTRKQEFNLTKSLNYFAFGSSEASLEGKKDI